MYPPNSYGVGGRPSVGGGPTPNAKPTPIGATSSFGNPATFTAAANTQASDYDKIMAQYADLVKSFSANPAAPATIAPQAAVNYHPTTAQTTNYAQSGDVTSSLSDLKGLADTGGYSEADKANIRERDISPTRSIYANAQQNIERSKALSGGYSPSFNATTAQMTRDEADQIGGINVAANAGIAQNVAANKLSAASPYASASASANAAKTSVDQGNTNIVNQINADNAARQTQVDQTNADRATQANEFNASVTNQANQFNKSGAVGAVQGQASLYGTTPALTNTFGNQVVQAGQLGQSQQNLNNQKFNTVVNAGR